MKTGSTFVAAAAICLYGSAAMATEKYPSTPKSCVYYKTAYVIAGKNPGGNRTCAEVGKAFYNDPYYYDSSFGKIDAGNLKEYLPYWLKVVTNGTYVHWKSDYPIGAVIVKGGPNANVYVYNPQSTYDNCLAAPPNGSGKPAGLSNITFCWKTAY